MPFSQLNNMDLLIAANEQSPDTFNWRQDSSAITMQIDTPFADRQEVMKNVIGYPKRELDVATGTHYLIRHLPANHPHFEWMWATSIQSFYRGVAAKDDDAVGKVARYEMLTHPYEHRSNIQYEGRSYLVLDESQINILGAGPHYDESERFVTRIEKPQVELITFGAKSYKFVDGPSAGNSVHTAPMLRVERQELVWTWHQIPFLGVHSALSDYKINDRWLRCYNKVNRHNIWGFPSQTLLLQSIEIIPYSWPVPPIDIDPEYAANPIVYDVRYTFGYTAPLSPGGGVLPGVGLAGTPPADDPLLTAPISGWNLVPNRVDNWWYAATKNGAGDGSRLYQSEDFSELFKIE